MTYIEDQSLKYVWKNKAGYMATPVACGWAGAMLERVTRASGQEWYAQKAQKHQKSNSRKSVTWSAVPDAPKLVYVGMRLRGAAAPEEPMTYDST